MKLFFTLLSLIICFSLTATNVNGQQVFKLNSIDSQSKQVPSKTLSGAPQERQYYRLNIENTDFNAITSGDYVQIDVAPGLSTTFKVNRVESYTPTTTSFITRDIDNPENTFTFTYSNGMLHGLFHKSHDDTYFFEYDDQASQNYVSKSSSFYDDEEFCSIHEIDHNIQSLNSLLIQGKSTASQYPQSHIPNVAAMNSSLENETTIDVMLLYTPNAKTWAADSSSFNTIENIISEAMALSQTALDNSNTNITLRLVHFYQTNYNEDSIDNLNEGDPDFVSAGDHLRRLTRDDDSPFDLCSDDDSDCKETDYYGYFENAHTLRDQYGADVVAAILSEPNTGGIGWVNSSILGSSHYAFSINRVQQIASNYTLIHEIGHNMGNAHARNQPSSAAGVFGGMFAYSTGNRFTVDSNRYATVMAYNDGGYSSIPNFSNPDVSYLGVPTGTELSSSGDAGPSNSARSMREIKRVIAAYRPTLVDPPAISVEESSITAELDQDNSTVTVPVTIQNSGTSDLLWDFDFDIESGVIENSKQQADQSQTLQAAPLMGTFASGSNTSFTELSEPGVIFSTNFESGEGFTTGDFPAIAGWRSFEESTPFEISDENPSDGNRHLRLPRRSESSASMFSRSPFFGPQAMGEFVISFDIATQDQIIGGVGETFDVYAYDGNNGALSSAIIIKGGNINVLNVNEQGDEGFSSTNIAFPTDGSYRTMEIRYNPNNRTVNYYLEGTQIASNPYPSGRKPDYMYLGQRNKVSGAYMDIDNIRVERLHSPFNWLTTESFGGVVAAGSSQTVNLTLTAQNVPTGDYQTVLQVRSNDPANPVIEVPISASIEMATSSENIQDLPQRAQLSQNFPNPFNPTTNILFTLIRTSDVTLEIFNITGQKVATLIQGTLNAGQHQETFDASRLSSGIYMYRLRTPEQTLTRQMILIK